MFCPNCGTPTQIPDQNFCKICGTNLLVVSRALQPSTFGEQLPAAVSSAASSPYIGTLTAGAGPLPEQFAALPFVQEEAHRQKIRKIGWLVMGGGILFAIFLDILGDALGNLSSELGGFVSDLGGFGALIFVAGLMMTLYARFILKKTNQPQVVIVQQPANSVGNASGFPSPVQNPVPPQLTPAPPTNYAPPPSVTENTTAHLDTPRPFAASRDTN
jgi:hypothetical protein